MIKFLSEFAPIIAFVLGFIYGDIYVATLYTLITSVVTLSLCYLVEKKLQTFSIVSSATLLISGTITLLTKNPMFIKMKPTILYIIFGGIFCISTFQGKPFMKFMLHQMFKFKNQKYWNILSYRFGGFFFIMALLNELVWRNFDDVTWVKFKVLGVIPLTLVFIAMQLPLVIKHQYHPPKTKDAQSEE